MTTLDNWYVLHIQTGHETVVASKLSGMGFAAFAPERIMCELHKGIWCDVARFLLPGYVFLQLEMNDSDYHKIRKINGVIRFLGEGTPSTVYPDEMQRWSLLMNDGKPLGMSRGIKTGNNLHIDSGPLIGLEGSIIKTDARRKRAKVQLNILGTSNTIELALEIVNRH